ncbi:twin-arginine translocase TatA/TatE family subunit [Croceibacterium aestuarii]|uniref:twin-arginine translocase TatA/TatE family subunit n=1 Tax=Croceibacterium aestuarii TaxID=3064139 RepID=UPI00272DEFEC|nr:twin-arginine translocase TatA/TatE family subunit [Croceibacterium sp. D39]
MGSFSIWHWLVVAVVVMVLFGRGKISETMGDFGKGLSEFRKGMKDEDEDRERKLASQNPDIAPPSKVTLDQRESGGAREG